MSEERVPSGYGNRRIRFCDIVSDLCEPTECFEKKIGRRITGILQLCNSWVLILDDGEGLALNHDGQYGILSKNWVDKEVDRLQQALVATGRLRI